MNTINKPLTLHDVIAAITGALKDTEASLHNPSYETGLLGYALYYLYLAKHTGNEDYAQEAMGYFDKAMAALDLKNFKKIYQTDSIDGHLAHIGRFIEFCKRHELLEIESDAYLLRLDDILFGLLKSKITMRDFDLNSGALAAGHYFLTRLKSTPAVKPQLEFLVESIDMCASRDEKGDYYWVSPTLFDRAYLGISHGSCMVISFLLSACENNIRPDTCRKTIGKAINFLLKHYRTSPYKGLFPNYVGDPIAPMQFSLCYGDLGIGYTLYRAARLFPGEQLAEYRDLVLNDCLQRTKEDNLTLDASIIYGAAGLAFTFDKLGALSGDLRFTDRARYWYEQIPTYAIHENRFAGFKSRLLAEDVLWQVSFGWGILGIGIASMIHVNGSLPPIDELLMIA
ncbi:lanthionine synthetase LanC family protein [Chitinophaga polysaccharea]|uniref:lanthionine synthetase LanC family protein n=1 Tax=Chitinophaga polysaccharea TaxID=1293035 RepID=UPI00115739FA|nr:lanthionine synthetase LanC family protein [Chitinophaga polysaccharea]